MGLLGALVGGTLGLMLGGPLGAMIGGALGYQVGDPSPEKLGAGRGRRLMGRCPNCRQAVSFRAEQALICPNCGVHLSPHPGAGPHLDGGSRFQSGSRVDPRTAQSAFMIAVISLAAKVAKADGTVTKEEVNTFDRFLSQDLGMSQADRQIAAQIFNQARDSNVPAAEFARQIRSIMAGRPDRLQDLVSLLIKIAWADGRLDPTEESLIRSIAGDLGLSSRNYEEAKALFSRGNLPAAFAVLGVEPTASNEEIKRNYRRLVREYHPDKLASKGLPEDFMRFATEKLQAINEAYEQIQKERGFS